jgi:hypothetical protein
MTVASQLKQTIAGLKGAQATMRLYAAQARHEEVRGVFSEGLRELDGILDDLEGRLRQLEFSEPQYKG